MNASVYLGLFVIGMALYATKTVDPVVAKVEAPVVAVEEPIQIKEKQAFPSRSVQRLYQKIKSDELLQKKLDGITLEFQGNGMLVHLNSDEIYESGEYSFQQSWMPILDRLAELLKPEQKANLEIKIHGFSDLNHPLEKQSSEFGMSDFTLSTQRAEWVAHYFERQWGMQLRNKVELVGHGATPKGKRIDLELYYLE